MKKTDIRQVPLLFLFAPTLLAAIAIYWYLSSSLQASYELQLKASAQHVVARIAGLSNQYLYNRRYSVIKDGLEEFVSQTESAIDNIVIYNKSGQFITALKLNQQVLNSSLAVFPELAFFRQDQHYLAFGRISANQDNEVSADSAIGFVKVSFRVDPAGQQSDKNKLIVIVIAMLGIALGGFLWRYRYFNFHRQLLMIHASLINLNKGFKHVRLPIDGEFEQINGLHRQINDLVSFYEKRLTMKHFEITALEQDLQQSNDYIAAKRVEKEAVKAVEPQKNTDTSPLLTTIYQAAYQILQSKLALIDNSMINDDAYPGLTAQTRETQLAIDRTISELNLMLNQIKRLADISAGQLVLQPEVISSQKLVSSISRLMAPPAHAKGLEFIIAQPSAAMNVEIDVNQLQQVLITLIQHSIGATSEGYVKLTVELAQSGHHSGRYSGTLCYKIQDSGIGFTPRQYNMLVEDQIDQQLFDDSWIYQGLGLLVAKKSIEAMGGRFTLKSLAGLGAELSIELDVMISDFSEPSVPDNLSGSILVYDPVMQSGQVIFNQLSELGILTILCVDEQEILAAFNKNRIDCAVLCRPVEQELQQMFDSSLVTLIGYDKLSHCVFSTPAISNADLVGLNLPDHWKVANKPFILTDLSDHFSFSQLAVSQAEAGQAPAQQSHSERIEILAVDDNETNLKLLSVILRAYPVNLVQALSGREALVMSQKQVFDLILMDKEMPDMDGLQTSQHIRQLALNKHTPIVAFTAHVSDSERATIVGEDINDCLEKPLDESKFYYLMDNWCQARWVSVRGLKNQE